MLLPLQLLLLLSRRALLRPVIFLTLLTSALASLSNSLPCCAEFKVQNPRYGDGGYRKSDPVTRYHAFKNKWDQSHFLNKKTTRATPAPMPTHATKAAWKA